jgi:hypothetical protein
MNNETDVLLELHERVAEARREVEHWQREYVSACAREDEQRRRANIMSQVLVAVWPLLQRLQVWRGLVPDDGLGGDDTLGQVIEDARPILAKLEELQR